MTEIFTVVTRVTNPVTAPNKRPMTHSYGPYPTRNKANAASREILRDWKTEKWWDGKTQTDDPILEVSVTKVIDIAAMNDAPEPSLIPDELCGVGGCVYLKGIEGHEVTHSWA